MSANFRRARSTTCAGLEFTGSRGMLERAKAGQGHLLKPVVDAKQRLVSNQYSVLTLSWCLGAPREESWGGPKHTVKTEA